MMNSKLFYNLALFIFLTLTCHQGQSKEQEPFKKYPLNDDFWKIENNDGSLDGLTILNHQGRQSLLVKNGQKAILKDVRFKNFVVDFYCNAQVPGLAFRVQDQKNFEYLYLRMMMSGNKDALQYLPIHNGNLPWQLYNYPDYEGKATFPRKAVATLPLTLKEELVSGKVSDTLLLSLKENGVNFSKETFIDIPEESPAYIFDPQSSEALLFETSENEIVFLDFKVWVHLKVEVLEDKMSVYIGDMKAPTFIVEDLKRDIKTGGISLFSNFGDLYFSDFSIKEIETSSALASQMQERELSPNYITQWAMSKMFVKDTANYEQQVHDMLVEQDEFESISADEDGLINVSRFYNDMEKSVIFTSTLVSESEKEVTLNFDFADQLVILLNSEVLFEGEMDFRPPPEKGAEGRVFVDDEKVSLNLKSGKNQLVFVLSGDSRQKFNWGFIAKLDQLNGISVQK
ncbi:hypothetical protein [Agaribacter flavus]|uniref:Lipoprotein n=1 Tax=Agaribacter flavus TaxID=1902781 RepID=A0ABV7FPH9_9ALTE